MSPTAAAIRSRLQEIASAADTAAGALDGAALDFLEPELARHLASLEALAQRIAAVPTEPAGRVGVIPYGVLPAPHHRTPG
jgi:hypothetical protein